jgi:predicted nucleic acid-binding protein
MVVSDTTTLRYLILIGSARILPEMYGPVSLPAWVYDQELQDAATPPLVRAWMAHPPAWIRRYADFVIDDRLPAGQLGRGEREAISLALQFQAQGTETLLLTDDKAARREALRYGVPVVRTLALLVDAAGRGLETPEAITRLERLPEQFPGLKPFYAKPFHFERARQLANAPMQQHEPTIRPEREP